MNLKIKLSNIFSSSFCLLVIAFFTQHLLVAYKSSFERRPKVLPFTTDLSLYFWAANHTSLCPPPSPTTPAIRFYLSLKLSVFAMWQRSCFLFLFSVPLWFLPPLKVITQKPATQEHKYHLPLRESWVLSHWNSTAQGNVPLAFMHKDLVKNVNFTVWEFLRENLVPKCTWSGYN